jgi:hypothetical protein
LLLSASYSACVFVCLFEFAACLLFACKGRVIKIWKRLITEQKNEIMRVAQNVQNYDGENRTSTDDGMVVVEQWMSCFGSWRIAMAKGKWKVGGG